MTLMVPSYSIKVQLPKFSKVFATIKFGVISMQCKGKGICSINIDVLELKEQQCSYAEAFLTHDSNGSLVILFIKSSMKECTYAKYFGTGLFEVCLPFRLPQEIIFLLDIRDNSIIPGFYLVEDTGLFLKITF